MNADDKSAGAKASLDEQRLALDERRLELDRSFARKWLPTLATVMVGLVATIFGYVQQRLAAESTERTRIESKSKDEREWGFKVVEMYFNKRELFDLTKNAEPATRQRRARRQHQAAADRRGRGLAAAARDALSGDDGTRAAQGELMRVTLPRVST